MSIMITTPLVIGPGSIGTNELVDDGVTAAKIGSGAAPDGQVLTADGAGGAAWEAVAGGGPGYLEYVALLTQSGTDAPVATVLANTLGGMVVWTRLYGGQYVGTLIGAFPISKTVILVSSVTTGNVHIALATRNSNDDIHLMVYSIGDAVFTDDLLDGNPIEIRVDS